MQKAGGKKRNSLHFINFLTGCCSRTRLISFTVLLGMRATVKPNKIKLTERQKKQTKESLRNAFNFAAAEMWQPKIKARIKNPSSVLVLLWWFPPLPASNPSIRPASQSIQPANPFIIMRKSATKVKKIKSGRGSESRGGQRVEKICSAWNKSRSTSPFRGSAS